jgi:hypothetical protein
MAPSTPSKVRRLGSAALGLVLGAGLLDQVPVEAVVIGKKACVTLERRLDGRLRRGLKGCAKGVGVTAALRCASAKRSQHVASLASRGCEAPAWAVEIAQVRVDEETVALVWSSRINWARFLDRLDDPIASSVRFPGDLFRNQLLLDAAGDVESVLDYLRDIEARAEDVDDGLPESLRGGGGGRPAFPSIDDHGAQEAVDVLLQVAEACSEGEPSMFADGGGFRLGGKSGDVFKDAQDPNSASDNGNRGIAFAKLVADIVNSFLDDDDDADPPADPPPAEPVDGQCTEPDEDGQCADEPAGGGDQPSSTTSTTVPPPPPPPPSTGSPAGDPGTDGQTCAMTMETMTALCESMDWQTPNCRAIVRAVNGCVDESLINPGPEGEYACSGEGMSEEEVFELQCEAKGGIAQPAPGEEMVCVFRDPNAAPPVPVGLNPCNSPEAQGIEEMCSGQEGAGPAPAPDGPPPPGPDPRIGRLR